MDLSTIQHTTNSAPAAFGEPAQAAQHAEDRRALIKAVRAINSTELFGYENELSFAFDRSTLRAVVRIVNKETREVVQQIPPEYVLRMAEELRRS